MNSVLFIETDESLIGALTRLLNVYGIPVQGCPDQAACLALLSTAAQPSKTVAEVRCLLISEPALSPEPASRQQSLERLCKTAERTPVILVAPKVNRFIRSAAMQAGAVVAVERQVLAAFLQRRLKDLNNPEPGFDCPESVMLENGLMVGFRIMQPADAPLEQDFVRSLSMRSRYTRFFSSITELSPVWLERFTHATFPSDNALIATIRVADKETIIGVARYGTSKKDGVVDFAVVVADDWQRQGLASMLMSGLIASATIAGIGELTGLVLHENQAMLKLATSFGFHQSPGARDPDGVHISKSLREQQ